MTTALRNKPVVERVKFSPPEVAAMLGVAREKILAWIRRGTLPAIDTASPDSSRPRFKIDLADIRAFEARQRVVPEVPAARATRRRKTETKNYFPD